MKRVSLLPPPPDGFGSGRQAEIHRGRRARPVLLLFVVFPLGCASARVPGVSIESVRTLELPEPGQYLLITPPSYEREPRRRFPVLYVLHDGYGNVRTLWKRDVAGDLRVRMAEGQIAEFLIVAPGAPNSWFSDFHDGTRRYEQWLTGDLPREVESRYRVLPGRQSRGITGISMGGYGAFKLAFKHSDLYGSVSSISGALIPFEWNDLPRYSWFARWTLKRVFGRSREDNSFAANDVWEILRGLHFETPPFLAHLRAGTEDIYRLDRVAAQFGAFLTEHGVPTSVVLEPGGHDWSYWRRAMSAIAEWHGRMFAYAYD